MADHQRAKQSDEGSFQFATHRGGVVAVVVLVVMVVEAAACSWGGGGAEFGLVSWWCGVGRYPFGIASYPPIRERSAVEGRSSVPSNSDGAFALWPDEPMATSRAWTPGITVAG